MSLKANMMRVREMGSSLRDELYAEALEFCADDNSRYEVEGVMSGVSERRGLMEGGQTVESDGQVRVRYEAASAVGLVPEVGMLVRRVSGARVYRVDAVVEHDAGVEWKLDVGSV